MPELFFILAGFVLSIWGPLSPSAIVPLLVVMAICVGSLLMTEDR